ncbi:hypothetical protein NB640_01390 [Oxalobacter vibrioformis]|uniref:Uncharacterized protein n=1 Tax=Oxalobacter vibrioformis TaxID=933080 RepID=A0A9E9P3S5_9BURK|nr:hypothetical protein [Oxalobacter vibrioformis]WAW10348.1 hypothetical protein NB640_01390 [Oxalobacter vibrioformis]
MRYSGEIVYGACSGNGTNTITILKRNRNSVTYNFGKTESTGEAVVETIENWGEYIAIGEDRFFAFAVDGT